MISLDFHANKFSARSVVFNSHADPFVVFEISSDEGSVTCYLRDEADATRIAEAALELLKNVQNLKSKVANPSD